MTTLIDQPTKKTARKVQASSWAAGIVAAPAAYLAFLLSQLIVSAVPAWQSVEAFEALTLLLELFLTGILTWGATWTTGYWVRAREWDAGQ
jgi:hypothetical protein